MVSTAGAFEGYTPSQNRWLVFKRNNTGTTIQQHLWPDTMDGALTCGLFIIIHTAKLGEEGAKRETHKDRVPISNNYVMLGSVSTCVI